MARIRHLTWMAPFSAIRWKNKWGGMFCLLSLVLASHAAESKLPQPGLGTNSSKAYSTELSSSYGLGWWIWADQTFDQQTCRFWRGFEIARSESVTYARIRMTADNSYRLFLDGREIGKGGEWRALNEYNVTPLLEPGRHELAIEVFSDYGPAGVIFGLRIELSNGRVINVLSDEKWKLIPSGQKRWEATGNDTASWPKVKVIAPFGEGQWKQTSARILQGPPLHPIIVRFWQTAWFQITLLSVCGFAILVSVYLMSQLSSQTKAQKFLRRERARIARDIHDDVGARLSHLVLLGERAQRSHSSDQQTREQFDQICERTREVLSAIDEVVWCVNSRRDTVRDFETYVCNYAETFLQSTNIRCRSEVDPDIPEVACDLAIRRNLFLAIKEAINNAAKYSGATDLILRIHLEGQELVAIVEDNGKGFEPAKANSQRNGLTNMSQRIVELGGKCEIVSRPGQGCRIEFRTPLVHSRDSSHWWSRFPKRQRTQPISVKPVSTGATAES